MADITNELQSLKSFVQTEISDLNIMFYAPKEPAAGDLAIQPLGTANDTETNYHFRIDREYQFVYYADDTFAVLEAMEKFESLFGNALAIPLLNSDRHLKEIGYSMSRPFETESGKFAFIGVLTGAIRQARPQQQFEKIQNVDASVNEG
jgi:hypothetical protein